MALPCCALSDPGIRRDVNEDSYSVRPDVGLFVVADGMGGHAAGDIASRAAVEAIEQFIEETQAADENSTWPFGFEPELGVDGNRLKSAFRIANRRIAKLADGSPEYHGMATTVAALLVPGTAGRGAQRDSAAAGQGGTTAVIGHVGDSRVYVWRGGHLERLTRDHSWVQEQVTAGTLSASDAREHPWRNLVTRALAGGSDPDADVKQISLAAGDRFLLCSDGLHGVVSDDRIGELLGEDAAQTSLQGICDALISDANRAGGPDNITALIVEWPAPSGAEGPAEPHVP